MRRCWEFPDSNISFTKAGNESCRCITFSCWRGITTYLWITLRAWWIHRKSCIKIIARQQNRKGTPVAESELKRAVLCGGMLLLGGTHVLTKSFGFCRSSDLWSAAINEKRRSTMLWYSVFLPLVTRSRIELLLPP